ncbi:hypothetical protein E4U58_000530 [Claviceps cyperi]|nr:hypothetical protein E4U58_000530 [Claviceps cyperi]
MQSVERQGDKENDWSPVAHSRPLLDQAPRPAESVLARRGRRPNCMRFTSAPTNSHGPVSLPAFYLPQPPFPHGQAGQSGLRARRRQEPQAHVPMMRSTSDGQSWADTAVHGGGRPRVNAWLASMKRQFAAADRSSQAQIPFLLVSHSSVRGFAVNSDALLQLQALGSFILCRMSSHCTPRPAVALQALLERD